MARSVSPPRTSIRRSPPAQRHSSSSTPTSVTTTINTTTAAAVATTPTTIATTNTTTASNTSRPLTLPRPAERPNVPIAPASSNTSSPIYSTTSSPPISPGISQYPGSTLSTMAPSRSDARSATLAIDLPPTSTPTGRISKAKKGKRVHACEFPGCGKIFTRAEHRRRHELNHNPDATYRCSQQGCGKSFHRLDLLSRHQERHELEASTQPSSPNGRRYPSQPNVLPESSVGLPSTSMASPQMPQPTQRTSSGGMSINNLVNPHSYHHGVDPSAAFGIPSYMPLFTTADNWEPIYAPDHMHSPHVKRFTHAPMSSTSSVASFEHTGSPMIPTTVPQAAWTQAPPPTVLPASMFEADGMSPYPSMAPVNPPNISLSRLDGDEWLLIGRELSNVPGLLPSPNGNGVSEPLKWHCFDLYWQCFHPTFPIVHRPTFLTSTKPPPLLSCAMVAIGSYYDTTEDAKNYSLTLLGIATKILRMRPSHPSKNHKPRIVDLQTVVLLEILSTFCARQISVNLSPKFRSLFASLTSTALAPPLALYRVHKQKPTSDSLAKAQEFWIDTETRSRILHACTILDSQQTTLFDQEQHIRRPRGATNTMKVNLPCNDDLWDADTVEKWARVADKHEYIQMSGGKAMATPGKQSEFSYFQQQAINANSEEHIRCAGPSKQSSSVNSDLMRARSDFDYHATWMCKHTPIRSLLVVTGESWLLGRKIDKRGEFDRHKKELRKWLDGAQVTNKPFAQHSAAHWHALKLLRILYVEAPNRTDRSEIFGTTNMLHENWVVYLASLVCWVQGQRKETFTVPAVANTATTSDTVSCLNDPVLAAEEAEAYFIFTNVSSPAALQDLDHAVLSRTQGLLETVRTQMITKHMMGGLMNDAEQVLLKLVEGKKSILLSFAEKS